MKTIKNKTKSIPKFKNEDEERDFWAKNSVLDFPNRFKPVKLDFSKLKPSTEKVTLRVPKMMLDDLRMLANQQDVPYQSLMKIFLAEKIQEKHYQHQSS
ncbi:BrnA antitoxin family protein [Candidatus Microgenomates bacterium]|nr:BrnA antitoxin family protein [Candidatus Microgenomates bacterium]